MKKIKVAKMTKVNIGAAYDSESNIVWVKLGEILTTRQVREAHIAIQKGHLQMRDTTMVINLG